MQRNTTTWRLGRWVFGGGDSSDLLEELHRQDRAADGLLLGRRTFEDLRGYWPKQSDDSTGIADYLNEVQKYVVSSTLTEPDTTTSLPKTTSPTTFSRSHLTSEGEPLGKRASKSPTSL